MEFICQWSKLHFVITYFSKQGEFTERHCIGCLWLRWNLLCCVSAPEKSDFFWSIWFIAPRLLPCCPQLVQVKPCPKCPCTPSESNLGCIEAVLFPCVIWGLDSKIRNCPSLARAILKSMSQPGMREGRLQGCHFPSLVRKRSWESRTVWQYPSVLILLQQKLCPVTEVLIPEWFLGLPCSLFFLPCHIHESFRREEIPSELSKISNLTIRGFLGLFPHCLWRSGHSPVVATGGLCFFGKLLHLLL